MKSKTLCLAFSFLALVGCTSIKVNPNSASFDETRYYLDLSLCGSGQVVEATLDTTGRVITGSLIGAINFAAIGAAEAKEAAIIGAIVGGTIGFGVGAYDAIKSFEVDLTGCLRKKGYKISSV